MPCRSRLTSSGLKTAHRNPAPRPRLGGENLDEAIRLREVENWSFSAIGTHFGICEASACNAVTIALCVRRGYRPAERDQHGRLTAEGIERLRYALKKGYKGIDIQLRLGVSAACVSEQRRRYNRELLARGKAALPRRAAARLTAASNCRRQSAGRSRSCSCRGSAHRRSPSAPACRRRAAPGSGAALSEVCAAKGSCFLDAIAAGSVMCMLKARVS